VRTRPFATFVGLAYLIGWGTWFLLVALAPETGLTTSEFATRIEAWNLADVDAPLPDWLLYLITRIQDFSFSIAGLIVIGMTGGSEGLRALFGRLVRFGIAAKWYLLGLLPLATYLLAAVLANDGSPDFSGSAVSTALFSLGSGLLVSILFRGAMGEELGLRGFAVPHLRQRMSMTRASLVIGVVWWAWHLPVLVSRDLLSNVAFFLLAITLSFVFTWLFEGSGGSLVPVLLFHGIQNWEDGFEVFFPSILGTDWELVSSIALLLFGIATAVSMAVKDRRAIRS
jgi:membrane protease YdiL (CAAX protease family)